VDRLRSFARARRWRRDPPQWAFTCPPGHIVHIGLQDPSGVGLLWPGDLLMVVDFL
jgi:hypothetical protein